MNVHVEHIDHIDYIVIDLFCGAGGTTLGYEDAEIEELKNLLELQRYLRGLGIESFHEEVRYKLSKVVACVNHDPVAIKSHWANHSDVEHFEEDITTLYGIIRHGIFLQSARFRRLVRLVELYRAFYPAAKIILWASLECTNFSKAKGGKPRDADSRTLAHHLEPYIVALEPDYIKIENVVEFMAWGPLDKNGKPVSRKNGQDWLRWRKSICDLGYRDEWREMNAADFGALTSRNRLFGCFAKPGFAIIWPEPTHAKNPEKTSLYKHLQRWEPVKQALDFSDEGKSVFNRKKPLSTKTMQRLFMGCVKHIAGGKEAFVSRYYGGNPEHRNHSVDEPAGVVTTNNRLAIVNAHFLQKYNSNRASGGGNDGHSVDAPAPVIATQYGLTLATVSFIDKAYSGKPEDKNSSVEQPAPTLTTKPHESLVNAFIVRGFSSKSGMQGSSIESPMPTITTQIRERVAKVEFISRYNGVNGGKHDNSHSVDGPVGALGCGDNHAKVTAQFLTLYYSGGGQDASVEGPCPTVPTNDRISKVQADFILNHIWGAGGTSGMEQPCPTVVAQGQKSPLYKIKAEKFVLNNQFENKGSSVEHPAPSLTTGNHHYLVNPSWGDGCSTGTDQPFPVVIARQDKAPLYLITCKGGPGPVAVPVYEGDCEWTIKLKEFMALYGIADIKMRMLKVLELKVIQGFPENYVLLGTQTDQKKFIGNAVHKLVPQRWIEAYVRKDLETLRQAA